jgi:N6-adenosine-specific RNA methylase IME4
VFAGILLGQARVVLADPPWSFSTYSPKGWKKSAHSHYACLSLDQIRALPVGDLCMSDAVCVMWTTQVFMPQTLDVLWAWGFTFKTMGTWVKRSKTGNKLHFGTGYIYRSAAEFFLVGTRGHPHPRSRSIRNVIEAPVREHSRKPDQMYHDIEALWPGPYVELFARHRRPGWYGWGDQLAASDRNDEFQAERGESLDSTMHKTLYAKEASSKRLEAA